MDTPPTDKPQTRSARAALKIALLVVFVTACLVLAHVPAVRNAMTGLWPVNEDTAQQGWGAGFAFAGAMAVLVAVGVPRLALWSLAGVTFGLGRGILFAEMGTLVGSYITFCFVRWAGREAILRKWPALERYGQRLGRGGWAAVLLARFAPIGGVVVNATLALSPVRHLEFLLASAAGFLPEGVPATLLGAGGRKLGQGMVTRSIAYVLGGLLLLGAGTYLLMRYRRRRSGLRAGPADGAPEETGAESPPAL